MRIFSLSLNKLLLAGLLLGIFTAYFHNSFILEAADFSAEVMIHLLRLISLPIIFLSLVSTISGMAGFHEMRGLGRKVFTYTLTTTWIAAVIGIAFFLLLDPVQEPRPCTSPECTDARGPAYFAYLKKVIPPNIVQVFLENNVIGALFLALLLSFAILSLPEEPKKLLHSVFSALFAAVLKVTGFIASLMPIGVWAFVTLFIKDFEKASSSEIDNLLIYIGCVIGANLVQGLIVLPILLKIKGISPLKSAKGMLPALSFAFFSKSSSASMPVAMKCAEEQLHVSRKISRFTFPLCTAINMNGCAAFIAITVPFVAMSSGVPFEVGDLILWSFVATLAAVGNAGVPMGCYFLSTAFLAGMHVPLELMAVILPFYSLIDMVETSLNVWSDSCIALVMDMPKKTENF